MDFGCLLAGMKPTEFAKIVGDVRVMLSVVNKPTWRGTRPHVTKTVHKLPQDTAQCLNASAYMISGA